jgi:hypothetical protein
MTIRPSMRPRGLELVEAKPVILGGDPTDSLNKAWVMRQQHFEFVRYWNGVLSQLRKQDGCS